MDQTWFWYENMASHLAFVEKMLTTNLMIADGESEQISGVKGSIRISIAKLKFGQWIWTNIILSKKPITTQQIKHSCFSGY